MATATLANTRLSLVNGTAFVDFSSAGTLTPYLNGKLTVTDSAGKKAVGYLKSAGTGETFGDELVTNVTFDSDTTGWTIAGGDAVGTIASIAGGQSNNCLEITRVSGTSQTAQFTTTTANGALYKASAYVKSGTSGNETFRIQMQNVATSLIEGTTSATWTQHSVYATRSTSTYLYLGKRSGTAGTMLFDEASYKQLLTPSSTGVTITSTRGGTTYNWESIESGFNYNDASGYSYYLMTVSSGIYKRRMRLLKR